MQASSESSWFSAALIPNPSNPEELLIVHYWFDWQPNRWTEPQVKFPGGSKKVGFDRAPEDTLVRELDEEVFKNGKVIGQSLLISEASRGRDGREHTKHFFLVHTFEGQLRRDDLLEEERGTAENPEGPVRTERLTPPVFVGVRSLASQIFHRHAGALSAYCLHLAEETGNQNALDAIGLIDARLRRRAR